MSGYWEERQRHEKACDASRRLAEDALEVAHLAAMDIAEFVIADQEPPEGALDTYKLAKSREAEARSKAQEAWKSYIDWAHSILGQDKEKPPAVAAAEGNEIRTNW
ncbi:hypothetical protein [Glutamicibacter sp. NPDC087344]|uniref:hypothetical protein n=1 Tax=Glutamicibacter sp. NPDC087344 TaxID=3363994 RepID=UPI00380AD6C5